MEKQNLDVRFDAENEILTERPLDIPEFLKGNVKEYVRMEKKEYQAMIALFNDQRFKARHQGYRQGYTRGFVVGAVTTMLLLIIVGIIYVTVSQGYVFTLPMAGP